MYDISVFKLNLYLVIYSFLIEYDMMLYFLLVLVFVPFSNL